jgi:Secretion system C-terminal sorting domain
MSIQALFKKAPRKIIATSLLIITLCIQTNATNYYVDNANGADGNNGLTPASAWQTLTKVNAASFLPGDSVLFIRGGTWRGQLIPKSGNSSGNITYSAYGNGEKPQLLGSVNVSNTSDWTQVSSNIWQSVQSSTVDIGNLIFNGGALVGFKKWTSSALLNQGDFWWDKTGTKTVQIYSTTNPASFYTDIEAAIGNFIVYVQLDSFLVLQNLAFKYGGADGVEVRNTHHFIMQDCDLSFIGGTELTTRVRYGGGLQFWAYSNNNIVQRCRFWEIYDDAVTNQCTPSNAGPAQQYNLFYRNNLIWNCSESSYCCDLRPAVLTGSFLKNIYFENNTCVNAGGGWAATQRPDLKGFQIYFSAITATTDSIFIRDNIFYKSRAVLFVDNSSVQTLNYTTIDYNDWFTQNNTDTIAALWTSSSLNIWTKPQFSAYQTANNKDVHSFMADPLLINADSSNFRLNAGSPCIGAGINTGVGNDFDLNLRPQTGAYDVGAFQYNTTGIQLSASHGNDIKIYPNPGNGNFKIEGGEVGTVIVVYNTLGDTVYRSNIQSTSENIDLSSQPGGTYFIRITSRGQTTTEKEIVISK